MNTTIERIKELVGRGAWKISEHAMDEIDEGKILPEDILNGIPSAEVIEDYPT